MHVTHLDDQASPLAVSSAPPFPSARSGETSSLRLAPLAADLSNGIPQQTPSPTSLMAVVRKPDPRHGIWILPLVIVAMVGSTAVFVNSLTPDVAVSSTTAGVTVSSSTSSTSTTVAVTVTTEPPIAPEVVAYVNVVDGLGITAAELVNRATVINQEWDDRAVSFGETKNRLVTLAADTTDFVATVEAANPGDLPSLQPAHLDIVLAARAMGEAADAMIVGLDDPNSSAGRRAALVEFQMDGTAVADAVAVVRIRAGVDPEPDPATTTTTTTVIIGEDE